MSPANSTGGLHASHGQYAAEAHHHDHEIQQALNGLLARSIQPLFDDIPFKMKFRVEQPLETIRRETSAATSSTIRGRDTIEPTPVDDKFNGRRENIPPANSTPSNQASFGEAFLESALQRLAQWRRSHNRVYDIATMSYREVAEEKSQIKKELKSFDSQFRKMYSRDPEKQDKEVIRSLYLRYNEMKAVLNIQEASAGKAASPSAAKVSQAARPSTQPADAKTTAARPRVDAARSAVAPATTASSKRPTGVNGAVDVERKTTAMSSARASGAGAGTATAAVGVQPRSKPGSEATPATTNGLDMAALKAEKRVLRKTLRNFETQFSERHGRVVQTPADMHPMLPEYQRYKYLRQLLAQYEGGKS